MYAEFYGLVRPPFEMTPDPAFLYLGETHREGLATLLYGVQAGKGFVLLTGEVGTGKTTLLHALLGQLDASTASAFLFNPKLEPLDFFLVLFDELGIQKTCQTKAEYLLALNHFLIERLERNQTTLLIIDEAQNLSPEMLEEVRLLSNLETPSKKLLQIMLVGQPELNEVLARPELRQLRQRIVLRHQLRPFDPQELDEYIAERLALAGYTGKGIFKRSARREIHAVTGGVPRLVNVVCDGALLQGYARDQSVIGADLIREVAADLGLGGAGPGAPRPASGRPGAAPAPLVRSPPVARPREQARVADSGVAMAKVYDALRRAEEERKRRSGAPSDLARGTARPRAGATPDAAAARPARRCGSGCSRARAEASEPAGDFNKRRISLLQPDSYVAEQFRSLRGRIDALAAQRPIRTIAVTSPLSGEGKTTAAINLAIVTSMSLGRRVLLIDCDLRKPKVHQALGLRPEAGLAEVLSDAVSLDSAILKVEGMNLEVLAVRGKPANPSELLSGPRMRELVEEVARRYDRVILDTPAALGVPDAKAVAELCDGLILVVRADVTPHEEIEAALEILDRRRLLGLVLNGAQVDQGRYGYAT